MCFIPKVATRDWIEVVLKSLCYCRAENIDQIYTLQVKYAS